MLGIFRKLGESDSECSSSMFRSSENKEFTFVNDCFQNKKKEEIGYYGQTLHKKNCPTKKQDSVFFRLKILNNYSAAIGATET